MAHVLDHQEVDEPDAVDPARAPSVGPDQLSGELHERAIYRGLSTVVLAHSRPR